MGLMNTHQVLKGARTRGYIQTYVLAGLIDKPVATVTGDTVSFTGGLIEFDGREFTLGGKSLDFGGLGNLITDGKEYLVCAVPSYNEYLDRTTAEAAGANYYITRNGNNEAMLQYFLPSAVQTRITAAGGAITLQKKRALGVATQAEIQVLNDYEVEVERLSDPRYVGYTLDFKDVEFILAEVYNQDNRTKRDATAVMTEAQFNLFKSTQGEIQAERRTMALAAANTAFGTKLYKVKRAFAYTSQANADANINGHELRVSAGFVTPLKLDGTASTGTTHVAVFEYTHPSYMPEGQEGLLLGKEVFLTKENSNLLGRINPIYMDNPFEIARTVVGNGARSALTKYADPQPLIKVRAAKDATTQVVTLTPLTNEYRELTDQTLM